MLAAISRDTHRTALFRGSCLAYLEVQYKHPPPTQHSRLANRVAEQKTAPGIFRSNHTPHARPIAAQATDEPAACTIVSYETASGYTAAPNRTAIPNANDTLLGRVNNFIATVGGQSFTNGLNTAAAAAVEAQKGAVGFTNALTFGASGTGGFNPNDSAFQTGRSIGVVTRNVELVLGGMQAFSMAGATPYFFSGAGAGAQAASAGYIVTDTAGGMLASGAQQALNTVFGAQIGGTIGYYGIWYPTSAAYAVTSGLLNGVVGYTGNGTGQIWTQVEQPILQALGTTIK